MVCSVPGSPTHLTSMSVGKPALELIIEWPAYHCCAFASGPALTGSSLLPTVPVHDKGHDDDMMIKTIMTTIIQLMIMIIIRLMIMLMMISHP